MPIQSQLASDNASHYLGKDKITPPKDKGHRRRRRQTMRSDSRLLRVGQLTLRSSARVSRNSVQLLDHAGQEASSILLLIWPH